MIVGPDCVVACPRCEGLARHPTLLSGNTVGMLVWTDGKRFAPMCYEPPPVVKCSHCGKCYWLAEAATVGHVDRREMERDADAARRMPMVAEPAEEEFYQALAEGLARNPEEERTLRTLAWWRSNDPFRDEWPEEDRQISPQVPYRPERSDAWRKNLEALLRLGSPEDVEGILLKAEIFRELGRFDDAAGLLLEILENAESPEIAEAAEKIRELCDVEDTCVRLLWEYR